MTDVLIWVALFFASGFAGGFLGVVCGVIALRAVKTYQRRKGPAWVAHPYDVRDMK